ncbi:DUF7620 family protein [Streptomonospora litoralis]|uniref:Uncharacterized protein n=1 Tax=Streptomonospora litoralis TaxID=2498135 RepID=A0A4P6QB42_9ACTN|nr:hypothetical protein [Streptomonospora litoralis]QBI56764.1 hypothetical protein EKD16_25115 [Streptomonospora litoralis]
MKWPWRVTAAQHPPPVSAEEAREARRCAEQARDEARARTPEVRNVVGRLRHQRRRNHFSELIVNALQPRRDGR